MNFPGSKRGNDSKPFSFFFFSPLAGHGHCFPWGVHVITMRIAISFDSESIYFFNLSLAQALCLQNSALTYAPYAKDQVPHVLFTGPWMNTLNCP